MFARSFAKERAVHMEKTDRKHNGYSTQCVHAGTYADDRTGGVNSPIFTSSAYAYPGPNGENIYQRYFNTPNQAAVAHKLAVLEKGEAAMVFASGMAAIATLLLSRLRPGDHAIFQSDLYGGTRSLVTKELTRFGIEYSFARTRQDYEDQIKPSTKIIYLESPSNPLLRCVDLAWMAAFARKRSVMTIVDNTFATPINQNPLVLGIDAVVHSATKYLNGHSDMNAGAVVSSTAIIRELGRSAVQYGGMLDAIACYQLERGLKTLALRVRQQNENALKVARFLEGHPAVSRVHYPGLPSHADHAVAAGQMRGFGGMLSFELHDAADVSRFLSRLRLVKPALSLGGVESLVCVPSQTSHLSLTPEERQREGIGEGLLRASIGIEDADDLLEDLGSALGDG
jgi:cystathionine beta-lyase